jgi:hypothetical protein
MGPRVSSWAVIIIIMIIVRLSCFSLLCVLVEEDDIELSAV